MSDRKKQLKDSANKLKASVEEANRTNDYYSRSRAQKSTESAGAGITQRSMRKFSSTIQKNENLTGLNKMLEPGSPDKPIPSKYWLIALFIIAAVFFVISLSLSGTIAPA
ncbi:MAG: hypothetical protein ABJO86_06060 [Lentilitoribacter sp.]